jgi:hypothetical protein
VTDRTTGRCRRAHNPLDHFDFSSERAADGQYVAGGWSRPTNSPIYNLPPIQTMAVPVGHRILLRQVCILAAKMEAGEDLSVSATHALSAMLSKLGATPADESKVNHGSEDDESGSEFFGGRLN